MKKNICLLLLFFIAAFVLHAQSDEKEIGKATDALNKALVERNRPQLEALTATNLTYGHSSGKIEDKTTFIENAVNGPFRFDSIQMVDETIKLAGSTAVVRGIFMGKGTNNGTAAEVKIGTLLVWQKQSGKWKLLARQAYKL